jgi:predicted nucleic acid-binding protein
MKKLLIDSGPLIALFDASDVYHKAIVKFIKKNSSSLITTVASLTEVLYLLDLNKNAQFDFLEWVYRGGVELFLFGGNDMKRIKELMKKYKDVPMDFADASLVYAAEKLKINEVVTIDKNFLIYRIGGRKKFKIIKLEPD